MPELDCSLRAADFADHAAIVDLHTAGDLLTVYAGRESTEIERTTRSEKTELWTHLLQEPPLGQEAIVALVEGHVMGFSSAGPDIDDPDFGKLYALFVEPDHWGLGIGSLLLDRAEKLLRTQSPEARLWVVRDNDRARVLYSRKGWTPDGACKVAAGTDWVRYAKRMSGRPAKTARVSATAP